MRSSISRGARPAELEAEREVVAHGEVRIERVALEDHRDVALARRLVRDVATGQSNRAGVGLFEPGDEPEQRGLPAAARADEHGERPLRNLEVYAAQDRVAPERLRHPSRRTADGTRAHARRGGVRGGLGRDGARRKTTGLQQGVRHGERAMVRAEGCRRRPPFARVDVTHKRVTREREMFDAARRRGSRRVAPRDRRVGSASHRVLPGNRRDGSSAGRLRTPAHRVGSSAGRVPTRGGRLPPLWIRDRP